ncbi:MAG: polysaccharide pyruvyl transferase family protein [Gammaproteobacteria bacterium]
MAYEGREQPFRVGISGSYGGLNLGDEAILQVIVSQLRRDFPVEITVFSRNPRDTLQRHQVDDAVPVREFSRSEILPQIQRLDLLILGGGGILFDAEAKLYLREAMLAREQNVPVVLFAVGAGPLNEPLVQQAVRETLSEFALLTVRERSARHVLEAAGVDEEILITADPALLLQSEPFPSEALERENLQGERRLVGMSVREPGSAAPDISEEKYHGLLADAADFMVDRFDAEVVLVPMERQVLDVQHSHAVVSKMLRPQRATVLKGEYSPGQILTLMKRFEFAVGMRLHFLIFAALQGTPFVALPYASKVEGFLEDLGMQMPPLQLVNAGRLIAHIDQSWDRRRSLKRRIEQAVPGLQARSRRTHELLTQILRR